MIATQSRIKEATWRKNQRGMLYSIVRAKLGITQQVFASMLGIKRTTLIHREHQKRLYSVEELCNLRYMIDLPWADFGALLDELVSIENKAK